MSDEQKERIKTLKANLKGDESIAALEEMVYNIPKQPGLDETALKKEQRAFFKDVYNLLIGRDTGPRLGTFLWAADRTQVLKLLTI